MLDEFVKNLVLVAPNKGEAKKSVSRGLIRIEASVTAADSDVTHITGMATDDVMNIHQTVELPTRDLIKVFPGEVVEQVEYESWVGYYLPDTLRSWEFGGKMDFYPPYPDEKYVANFDLQFWVGHVWDSINGGEWVIPALEVELNPERLRKFSLLSPRGEPLTWRFVEWADRSIIRWWYGDICNGVYAPLDILENSAPPWNT